MVVCRFRPRHPLHDGLVQSRRPPSSRTRRNQYDAAGVLQHAARARRRNDATRCNSIDKILCGPFCADMTSSIKPEVHSIPQRRQRRIEQLMARDSKIAQQEALLPQADRATRYISQNLVSCRNKLCNYRLVYNKWSQRVTVDRLVVNSRDSSIVVYRCRRQAYLLSSTTTSFVDNSIDLPWRNFKVWSLGQSSRGKYPNFWRYRNFLITHCGSAGLGKVAPCQNQLDSFSRFYAIYWLVTDGQRRSDGRTHDDNRPTALAWRCAEKNCRISVTT